MKIYLGIHRIAPSDAPAVVTIGNFDGVHLGHQSLLERLKEVANTKGHIPTLVLFEPQPKEHFAKKLAKVAPARVYSLREKVEVLASDIQQLVILPFNEALQSLTAAEFVQALLVQLNTKHLIIGDDFRFGCNREGDFNFLCQSGKNLGFEVEQATTVIDETQNRISSTRVRSCLAAGDFNQASLLMGRAYELVGRVAYGRQLGRTLGVPTANLGLRRPSLAIQGVFVVEVLVKGQWFQGVANAGVKPTVDGQQISVETHLFDFNQIIYGDKIRIRFLKKIRDEAKFDSLQALKLAIEQDIQFARGFFKNKGVA